MKNVRLAFLFVALPFVGFSQTENSPRFTDVNTKMFQSFLRQSERGDPKAMLIVGQDYLRGIGVGKNTSEAQKWIERAAEGGNVRAWNELGLMYKYGRNGKTDYNRAFYCFSRGTDLNDPMCIYSKGYMLYKGIGCQQNYGAALALFIKASSMNVHEAMYFQGLCYRNGYGVPKDEALATKCLTIAAKSGDKQAVQELYTKESEFSAKSTRLQGRLAEVQKIIDKNSANPAKYLKVKHDAVAAINLFSGKMSGYLVKYDWSGEHILDIRTIALKVGRKGNIGDMEWVEEDENPSQINTTFTNDGIKLGNLSFRKSDHYNVRPSKTTISDLSVKIWQDDKNTYIIASINSKADEKNEPERPQSLILIKPNDLVITSLQKTTENVTNENDVTYIKAFPNPVSNHVTVVLTLNKPSTVTPLLYDVSGRQVFKGLTQSFGKGTATLTIPVTQSKGQYVVKMQVDGSEERAVKIIKQ